MTLPRFYPIFDSAAWLERALPLGVPVLQYLVGAGVEVGRAAWRGRG